MSIVCVTLMSVVLVRFCRLHALCETEQQQHHFANVGITLFTAQQTSSVLATDVAQLHMLLMLHDACN